MPHHVLLLLVSIGVFSLVAQWLAWRMRVPAILFLLAFGLAMGPGLGLLDPDQLFGNLLFPFISLSVAVILFEGSLTLRFEDIRGHGKVVSRLITWGVAMLWLAVAGFSHWFVGLDWPIAFLFGSIMTVTGPTVIMPMIQAVRPTAGVARVLRWEGILVDPLGAMLAVLTFSVIVATQTTNTLLEVSVLLVKMLVSGLLLGGAVGYVWGLALRRYWLPSFLHNVATLLVVFAVFALADLIAEESGLLAVTVMGVWLANTRGLHIRELLDFKESLSILLISGLFIILAARLDIQQLQAVGWPALAVMLGIQFVARPLKVMLCSVNTPLTWPERWLLSWMGPRGIIAAAISAVFALRLEQEGIPGADSLVPMAFVVIAGTVVLQSLTARPIAKLLGVVEPEPEGVLIYGANTFSQKLAKVLIDAGFRVVISHSDWDSLRAARMAGIPTYYGNPMSNHAERTLELSGIGKLFAMSRNVEMNQLACTYFAHQFGRQNVYFLPVARDDRETASDKHAPSLALPGRRLFSSGTSLSKALSDLGRGSEIKTTRLTEDFNYEKFLAERDERNVLLAYSDKRKIEPYLPRISQVVGPGWTIVSLVDKSVKEEAANGST